MLDNKRKYISRVLGVGEVAGSERVPVVALEEVSWQRITPTRFPNNRTSRSSISNIALHKQTDFGCNAQGSLQGRPTKEIIIERPPQVLKILDPEQRANLMYEYTEYRDKNFGTVSYSGRFGGLK